MWVQWSGLTAGFQTCPVCRPSSLGFPFVWCREGVLPTMVIVIFHCFYLYFCFIFTLPFFYLVFAQVLAYISQTSYLGLHRHVQAQP